MLKEKYFKAKQYYSSFFATLYNSTSHAGIINNLKLKYKKLYAQGLNRRFECNEKKMTIEEQQNLDDDDIVKLQQILKEFLDDEQIIDLVTQSAEFDSSSSKEELALISHKEGLNALTTFIDYFEQQANEFKVKICIP
ncbi:hypothetical protein F8M41_004096 [Gigaspora margarita]|uniref:Uncharacterized protein n=1 Tax=Gigaspora margarita TaxID=4874 RepID=A0A8H4AXW5_GIGMA|nr:hypothetical protein F8M41_004096 [Gigaspora margarita]